MKKAARFLIGGYLAFLFLPYIFVFLMYLFLKKMAKPGSGIEMQVHELESELINIILMVVRAIDPNFILMNISGLMLFICILYFLKKYKFVIQIGRASCRERV